MNAPYILPLEQVGLKDLPQVGGKNASLGEMLQNLSTLGIEIPGGFVITVASYQKFIEENNLNDEIQRIIKQTNISDIESLRRSGLAIRQLIRNGRFPKDLAELIIKEYQILSDLYETENVDVAVRSSATAEDLPDASFAGQQESYLNVRGPAALINAIRNCFASLFTDRAISYRENFGYDHFSVLLSVTIQKMVRSDLASSGVAFSLDTESGFKDVVLINGSLGLGEMVVQGSVSPDEWLVFKPTLAQGFSSIIEKKLGNKDRMMVYGDNPDERVRTISTEKQMRETFCLSDSQVIQLSKWVVQIENYYSTKKGKWVPVDVEWAVDGITNRLYIVQARPETIHSRKDQNQIIEYKILDVNRSQRIILKGIAVGDKIATGKTNILFSLDKRHIDGHEFKEGDVLVTDMTDPDWEPIMKKASAIITNKGGRTCHAAIVAREMGVPAIVGCGNATNLLNEDQLITVSCAEGAEGIIYNGHIEYEKSEFFINHLPPVKTPIMLNVGSPNMAFQYAHLPNKGVGLAREEFIINNYIQIHPMALLRHKTLNDEELSNEILQKIIGFQNEEEYFVLKLAYGISKIASAFYPNKVIVRFSDFKSNEYFNLLGGKYFEPHEENPMIGWRGASRYYSENYKEAFGLECKAIKFVREQIGLSNVVVMVPFCRTVEELQRVQLTMKEFDLERGQNGLEIYLMAELPSNIIMAEEFAPFIDGFSIGSNDLTQLTLGLDRDSSLVAHLYDERNTAVKRMIEMLINSAKKTGTKVGICGQGPSDFPDFAQFLVEKNIDSISVTPDSIVKTYRAIHFIEQQDSLFLKN
jgi:pyruvate, water dikinase